MKKKDNRPKQAASLACSEHTRRKNAESELQEKEKRLEFEMLLSDFSARFINLPMDRVDDEIINTLRRILDFFQVDRCGLIEVMPERQWMKISHASYADGITTVPQDSNIFQYFPWLFEKVVVQGQPLTLETLDDFPPEALEDKQGLASRGVISAQYIPISLYGQVAYVFVLNAVRRQRSWPEEYIPRVRLLGEVLVNALARRKGRLQLEEQLAFEMLLAEISGRFVNLSADQVDSEIEDAQCRICEFLELDLSVLWQWSMDTPRVLKLTHLSRPMDPHPDPMYAHEYFPWCQKQLEEGRIVVASNIEDLPAEAARDQETWRQFGVKTTLTFPLSSGGSPPFAALSFNDMQKERTWSDVLIQRIQLIAQIFSSTLVRKQKEQALRESEARLRLITESVNAGLWSIDLKTNEVWASPKNREQFHFSPDEKITYEDYFRVIHPDDREHVHEAVQHTLKIGENFQYDYRIVLHDGSIRWLVARGQRILKKTGEPERMIGLTMDITERKEIEIELNESNILLSSLINSTSDLIWSVDPERFGLINFNCGLSEYFLHGTGLRIKTGMTPYDLLPKDFAEQWDIFYRRALEAGSFITEYKTSAQGRTLRLNINTLKHDDVVFGISVFAQDFTSRKKLEDQLKLSLEEVQQLKDRLQMENVYLRKEVKLLYRHTEIVGESNALKDVLAHAEKVSSTDTTVLLLGETGTGKELLAHAIHDMSKRKDRMLVMVNCASLPPTLIESELFGREKGAYTGSLTKMVGRFELADRSTLFLDEIGDLPLELQSKLLRVLEQGEFERLGSSRTIKVNVRLIAATNRDLAQDVKNERFRKDLYYRLNVFPITIPPLRERKEDIPSLVWSFVKQFEKSLGKPIESIPKKNMEALMQYRWPGNIRELRNVVEHAMILTSGKTLNVEPPAHVPMEQSESSSLQDMERSHIIEVLERTDWRLSGKNGAAEILGMKRTTLQSKMKALGIKRPPKGYPILLEKYSP
jgi:PAS domain S-box-containing protein